MPGFSKQLRLLNACDFQSVFAEPSSRASHPNLLVLARQNQLSHPRLGIVVAKKNVRFANQRNRIKRLIRESFRHQQDYLGGIDVIVLARKNLDQFDNAAIYKIVTKQWQRLQKHQDKNNPNQAPVSK
ncbi:ribonuclease P protein component [Halioxenophilus sp. WMMB6]|uniref:ribonuclease P protein component n=1 Tax=Halioxenophilus sp. WMMB6 TaxID=3073815 RepID=UPI00295F2377|nr:ribonuclease P protein component [Halioxenophilus sp. WMMB6]